jgi:hypothetical protein
MNAISRIETYEAVVPEVAKPLLPTFKPRWWFKVDRLDARPVVWSLRNRPQEWSRKGKRYTLTHMPSQHTFWIGNGVGSYGLYDADCGCSTIERKFQRFQQITFHRAYRSWRRYEAITSGLADHFASHFIN